MGQVKRKTPHAMPTKEQIAENLSGLTKKFHVVGNRGTRARREPSYDHHSKYAFVGRQPKLENKHLTIFIHGYNVDRPTALKYGQAFFKNLQTSLKKDGQKLVNHEFMLFTWPGDTGPVYFNDAQEFAQHSGVALFSLIDHLFKKNRPKTLSIVTHSLGAHVALRACSILGNRHYNKRETARVDSLMLLAPAVENDVFRNPTRLEQYHFPDSAFGIRKLHMMISRADQVLKRLFLINEMDRALGYRGPESMKPLKSLSRRVEEVFADLDWGTDEKFAFQLHDMSPNSTALYHPELPAQGHSDYWSRRVQTNYYVNFLASAEL